MAAARRVIGYVRVSTDEQAAHGHGLAAQRAAIIDECSRRGWDLVEIIGESRGASGKTLDRAGVQRAMARLDRRDADVLMVARLDRLSRSLAQGSAVIERASSKGWSVVALDLGLDMSSPAGELVANSLLSAARFERRIAGDRTKAGLAAARAKGVRLGRPQALPDAVVDRIVAERAAGTSLPKIAAGLVADNVPTAQGGASWYPSTVSAVLKSQAAVVR